MPWHQPETVSSSRRMDFGLLYVFLELYMGGYLQSLCLRRQRGYRVLSFTEQTPRGPVENSAREKFPHPDPFIHQPESDHELADGAPNGGWPRTDGVSQQRFVLTMNLVVPPS